MKPQQYIDQMGAGWNMASLYDNSWYNIDCCKLRYWCCRSVWQYKVNNGGYSNISVFNESYNGSESLKSFSVTFTPTSNDVTITLKHPVLQDTTERLPIKILSAIVDGVKVSTNVDTLMFPIFASYESTLAFNCNSLFSTDVLNKKIVLKLIISTDAPQFPTTDTRVLSRIRKELINRVIKVAGFEDVNEAVIKAVKLAGFTDIRLPIQWMGRCDILDELGNVHIDTEFLDHLAQVLEWCHKYDISVCINMHHDDNVEANGWLTTTNYLNDPTTAVRYKSMWTQIATYFKDYGDWLMFGSNNEPRNGAGAWENPSTTDVYGLMQMQKDFYDVVRNIEGNEHRICWYSTYAAKTSCLNSKWVNPNNSKESGVWTIPYNDEYGIAEIHPYAYTIANIQALNKIARSKGLPIVYGEFGAQSTAWNSKNQCVAHAYTMAYAKYYHMGAFIWDDDGNMRILNRKACTMSNAGNKSLWNGNIYDFIPNLIKCANLEKADILLDNRRKDCYIGDTVSIYLDTKESTIISNEGNGTVALNGNSFVAGDVDIDNLLAISYDGLYNTIDVKVNQPNNWNETVYNDISQWVDYGYSIYKADGYKVVNTTEHAGYKNKRLPLIGIDSPCAQIEWHNTTNWRYLIVIEYDSNKSPIYDYNTYHTCARNSTLMLNPATKYIGVCFEGTTNGTFPTLQEGTELIIRTRDMSQIEENDRTDNFTDLICDYDNYNISLYRTIEARGGVDYTINMGDIDCKVYIREFNNNKVEAEGWYNNLDTFTTNLFTTSIRIEIEIPNAKIKDVVDKFNDKILYPTLSYSDFNNRPSNYNEDSNPIVNVTDDILKYELGQNSTVKYLVTIEKYKDKP